MKFKRIHLTPFNRLKKNIGYIVEYDNNHPDHHSVFTGFHKSDLNPCELLTADNNHPELVAIRKGYTRKPIKHEQTIN